jgi:stalled ribosome rescue protein Dom34
LKLLAENLKDGIVKLVVNDINDLWHLQNIIKPGDFVTAKTLRTIFIEREETKEKVKKKLVLLKIKVEKVEFAKSKNVLRIAGKIEECPEEVQKGSYHTIEVHVGKILKIEKVWKEEELERLKKARIKIKYANGHIIGEFLMHVGKDDGFAAYGIEQVKNAAVMGAVKILLVPEDRLHEKEFEEVIKEAEKKRSEILFVSKKKDWTEKFCRQYDIAALLRFPVS